MGKWDDENAMPTSVPDEGSSIALPRNGRTYVYDIPPGTYLQEGTMMAPEPLVLIRADGKLVTIEPREVDG